MSNAIDTIPSSTSNLPSPTILSPTPTTLVDINKYPMLNHYKIPINDKHTRARLLHELFKVEQVEMNYSDNVFFKHSFILPNVDTPTKSPLYVQIPTGTSSSTNRNFTQRIKEMIKWREKCGTKIENTIEIVLRMLEKISPNTFLQVSKDKGYCNNLTPKITATYWIAMSEAAGLRITQQRIIKRYLSFHLGDRVAISESNIRNVGSDYLPYEVEHINVDEKEYGIKSIKISWRPLDEVILNYASDLFAKLDAIDEIDLLLGGDHGKGVLIFLVGEKTFAVEESLGKHFS